MLDHQSYGPALDSCVDAGVLSRDEADLVGELFAPGFPFADALSIAESVHVQLKVADEASVPHDAVVKAGGTVKRQVAGFHKYGFADGLYLIFTTGPIAEDDLIPGAVTRAMPFVDHLGIDLREDTELSRDIFTQIPCRGGDAGWRSVRQGAPGSPVRGCYCEISEKLWLFPPDGPDGRGRPIEFAFGEVELATEDVGCDYRPIDPAHPMADLVPTSTSRAPQSVCQ